MAQGGGPCPKGRAVNRESAEPEVVFRIVHVALDEGFLATDGLSPPPYREQAVEVGLGPNPTFQNGRMAALRRRVRPGQIVNAVPPSRRKPRPLRRPKPVGPPRIVETLRKAIEWRRQLDAGEVPNQAAIARREGISRARVTRIMALLLLAPAIQKRILSASNTDRHKAVSEPDLRPITRLDDPSAQLAKFRALAASAARL